MRILRSDACLEEGATWLASREPRFAMAYALCRPIPLRRTGDGFARLLSSIVSQQLSVAAASSIWTRLEERGLISPEAILAAPEADLRAVGLSRQKIRYARALAAAGIDYPALRELPTQEVVRCLTHVPGIGVWTAEIYAMFALGHADAFAAGDLALQEGARLLFDLPGRPTERALRRMAEDWSPWRAVAARILWGYYRVAKSREGVR
ncbi:DNA-3-methyladenine glycosylase II [Rubellimicrobium thermophilum DSM 16684]|uniref:DNA-3-methyladenine glycosylase II n=1 Tax=Rubellimicrobium thermophilum DSM 16684 TaxID=1123069 RepID=S9QYI1_9RHOB|nr:DNA-3-methyladenine glycosylase [Rubellimicrobium thermophilum]EPX86436.1 DNA-3-methyladenine glycosylase II [Rubellimicrobium thermophilum DSM 16684]